MTQAPDQPRLTRTVQLRMTDAQYDLLKQVASRSRRSIGAIVRDVVTVWLVGHEVEADDASRDQVLELVAELQQLGDEA